MSWWPPTLLCEVHDRIITEKPEGRAARRALWTLRLLSPILWALPGGNIAARHHLVVGTLLHELGGDHRPRASRALRITQRLCRGPGAEAYPYLEGWSYLRYIERAYTYLSLTTGPVAGWDELLAEQTDLHRAIALPSGRVPTTDTSAGEILTPDGSSYVQHPAFTVRRTAHETTIVHHDPRLRSLRARLNLHVGMNYGRAVREDKDWHWYEGWPKKSLRGDLWWRVRPPVMRLEARGYDQVVLHVGEDRRTIRL